MLVSGSSCDFCAVDRACSPSVIFAVNSLNAVGSFKAFSISEEFIEISDLPDFFNPALILSKEPLIAARATSVSFVQDCPKACISPSKSPRFLLNLLRASLMLSAFFADSDSAPRTLRLALSFIFLSFSAIVAFSSRVKFCAFILLRSASFSAVLFV